VPAGAWALFAVHGTGIPAPNDLYDADVHGVAARVFESGIDADNGVTIGLEPRAVAMFANGAEGNTLPETRVMARECAPPVQRRELRPGSWRTPPGSDQWLKRAGHDAAGCVAAGIEDTREVGTKLGNAALALFRSLDGRLNGGIRLSHAFEHIPLRGEGAPQGLCPRGRVGMAQSAGAETRETRFLGFRWFGIVPSGMEPGGSSIHPSAGCWSPKRTTPGLFEKLLIGDHGFEEAAQFLVARVGNTLIGAVPFEPTTTTGARLRRAMWDNSRVNDPPDRMLVVGLASNYLGYVSTRLEYALVEYEGAFTLYGPGSEEVFSRRLGTLTRRLAESGWSSPGATIPEFQTWPGAARTIVRFGTGEPPSWNPVLRGVDVAAGRVVLRWDDDEPGWVIPQRAWSRRKPAAAGDRWRGTGRWISRSGSSSAREGAPSGKPTGWGLPLSACATGSGFRIRGIQDGASAWSSAQWRCGPRPQRADQAGCYRRSASTTASIPGSRPPSQASIVHGAVRSGASVGTAIGFLTTGP
jgi:hypothetical protein